MELFVFSSAFYLGDLLRDFNRNLIFFISDGIWLPSLVFCVVMLLSSTGMGLYQRAHDIGDMALLLRIIAGFLVGGAILSVLFNFFPQLFPWHRIAPYAMVVSLAGILVSRFLFFKSVDRGSLRRRILVLGAGNHGLMIQTFESRNLPRAFKVIGYLRMGNEPILVEPENILALDKNLLAIADDEDIDEIVIAPDDRRGNTNFDQILDCKIAGYHVVDLLSFFEREAGLLPVNILQPGWLVYSDGFRLAGMAQVFKRCFDVFASLTLLIVTWPFFLFTTIAILIESGWGSPHGFLIKNSLAKASIPRHRIHPQIFRWRPGSFSESFSGSIRWPGRATTP